jgi:hypothetical protein
VKLTKKSETSTKITFTYDKPSPETEGYIYYANDVAVSRTFNPNDLEVTFGKVPSGRYAVDAVGFQELDRAEWPDEPPPPLGDYPASFFTGPLGAKNVVPNNPDGGIVITWTGITGNSEQQQRDLIKKRMADCGRKFDGIQYQEGGLDVAGQRGEDWIHSEGMLPCFTWNTFSSPASILSGADNGKIDGLADRFKSKPYRVMIRLMHEFDLGHVPYHPHGGAAQWVQSWRYQVDRIKARGATNIGFWWCPTEQGGGAGRTLINACYPGDEWVDWVGSDLYNNVGGWSSPLHEGWAEFDELVNYNALGGPASLCSQYGPRKPFVVGETGCRFDPASTGRKAQWFRNIDAVCRPHAPHLRGVAFFDHNTGSSEYNNWLVDTDQSYADYQAHDFGQTHQATYQGWIDFMKTTRWKGGIRP